MRQSDLPVWALDYKAKHKGVILRVRGNRIYAYKKTSKRKASSKYPVSSEVYLGVLTEDHGLVPVSRTVMETNNIVWAEYGWTRIILERCTDSWKKAAGKNAEVILHACIIDASPHSYLTALYPSGFDAQILTKVKTQKVSLFRRLHDELKIDHKELEVFKNLLVLCDRPNHYSLTMITEEMRSIASRLNIDLQVMDVDEFQFKITI